MKRKPTLPCVLVVSVLLAALTGCAGDDRVAEVSGTVTLDGDPIDAANVTFMPTEGGRPAVAVTDADGNYALSTFGDKDGAVIGTHTVTIEAVEETVSAKMEEAAEEYGSLSEVMVRPQSKIVWRVPQIYSERDTSGLEFEVIRGQDNVADFLLDSK